MLRKQFILFRRCSSFLGWKFRIWALLLAVISFLGQLLYGGGTGKVLATPKLAEAAYNLENVCPQAFSGRESYEAGEFENAQAAWEQALQTYQSPSQKLCRAIALSNLALVYHQQGKLAEADRAVQQSLSLIQPNTTSESTRVLAQALNTQGKIELARGQADTALNAWQQAEIHYKTIGDRAGMIRSQINQAQALQNLGQYREAGKQLLKVLEISEQDLDFSAAISLALEKLPNSPTKVVFLNSLGNVYLALGDYKSATQCFKYGQTLADNFNMPQMGGDALLGLGNVELALAIRAKNVDNIGEAEKKAQAAINYYQQIQKFKPQQIQAQLNQFSLAVAIHQWRKNTEEELASNTWQAQLQHWINQWSLLESEIDTLPLSSTKVSYQVNLAQSLIQLLKLSPESAPDPKAIIQLLDRAIAQAQTLEDKRLESHAFGTLGNLYEIRKDWQRAKEYTLKAQFLAVQAIETQDIAYQWQWQLGHIYRAQGNNKQAIKNYQDAVKELQLLRGNLVGMNAEVQFSFRDNVEPLYRELIELLLTAEGTAKPSQENLRQALQQIEALQLAELENYLQCDLVNSNAASRNELLDTKAAKIYPIILEKRLAIIYRLPGQPLLQYSQTAISRQEVEKTVKELRALLLFESKTPEVVKQSQKVYPWFRETLEAIERQGDKIDTLVFVPDGILRNVPMSVLYDGREFLVQKNYAIALTLPRLEFLQSRPSTEKLKVFTGGLGEPKRVKGMEFEKIERLTEELEGIADRVPARQPVLNEDFTAANLKKQLQSGNFSAIHFKTHGKFSSDPEYTFLVAYKDEIEGDAIAGTDLADLIQSSKNNIELLVLSACSTAEGDNRAALGLAGIAVRAGARSTLSTLWKVNDNTNTEFMLQFYQSLAEPGTTKAQALHDAQKRLLEQYPAAHVWAAYVLVGNWL